MTSEQFAYWLQGFSELNPEPPTPEQWASIREHLATVFHKVTPPLGGGQYVPRAEDILRTYRETSAVSPDLLRTQTIC